jgi:SAM-dependent methyltransferase
MSEAIPSAIRSVLCRLERYREREIDLTLSDQDDMLASRDPEALTTYLGVGRSAVQQIAHAMILRGVSELGSVLDMACGYGRVLRHLVAFLPEARIVAYDLYPERVEFCRRTFGVEGAIAAQDPAACRLDRSFDLIWCGSLVTHLPRAEFDGTLELCARSLSERGIAVVSVHGRFSAIHQYRRFAYLPQERFARVEQEFRETGFGYADYPDRSPYRSQKHYGVSLASPSYVTAVVERLPDVRLIGYHERAWDDHHDVVILARPGVAAPDPE